MTITKIILQQMVTMDQNSVTASKYPKYTIVLGNTISSITAAELTSAIESSKASAAAAKQSEINAKQSELNAKDSENEAEISAASSQQSATQSASSATASANSAKAAKTSETNAKASETAAKTSETNAKASETAAKTSETNANSSKTAAAASASAAKTSETNAAASASAASSSAAAAKTDANKAKVEADRAKAEADRASANSYTISFSGGAGWFKLATVTMPQSTSTVSIKMVGGKGYNANSPQQAGITELVLRAGNGRPKGLSGSLWRRTTEGFSSMAWINTSGDVYDVYVEIGNYATAVNLQVNYTTNASVVLHSQPQYYATKPEGLTTCTIYDLYNPLLPPPDDGTSLKKAQNLSDLPDKSQARTNLRLDRFRQFVEAGETQVKCADETKHIYIKNTGEWGAWDNSRGLSLALPITQGGTGGLSISEAKTNLQIPSVGAGDWMEIAAPAGVEAGKYYPIVINAQRAGLYLSGFFIDIQTRSSSGGDPMNCCTFNGFIRTGGWSDRKDAGYGYYNRYEPNELALKCILVSGRNSEDNIAVYVEGRAFPVKMRIPQFCTATAVASASTYGKVTFAWGTPNPATDSVGVTTLFDFSLNRAGFYQAAAPTGNYYIGNGERIVLSNGMSVGDELSLQAPKISFSGTVAAGNGFIADGTSVSNATFYSRYRIGDVVYGAEFRAAENAAQVIVRDPAGTSHQFFNFNLNGTFSPPNGLLTSTGTDWNGQKNTNNKFYGIAGSGNAPENATYGGVHVGFSGNYATQFAGRNSKFWVRSIEAGENKEWLKLITATLAPKTPTDARDGFISDSGVDTSWAPSSGGGFQSSYAENRIMQSWVDGSGRLYSRFLTTNQPTTSKTVAPWKSAAMLELNNRFTGSNTFLGDILCSAANPLTLTSANPTLSFVESDADNSTYMFVSDGGSFRLNRDNTTGAEIFNYSRSQNNLKFGVSSYFSLNTRFDQGWTSRGSVNVTTSGYSGIAIITTASTDSVGARNQFEVAPDNSFYLARRNRSNSTGQWIINFPTAGGTLALSGTSDINYKTNIEEYDGIHSIENIKAMDLVTFVFKDDEKKRTRRGVIAQQIEQIDPTYVKHTYEPCGEPIVDDDGVVQGYTDTKERIVLDNNVLLLDALCAIKVLAQRDEEKTERINKLEKDVEDLKTVVEHLLTTMKNS